MTKYVWQHDLKGESDRLRLMSDLLDPSSEFHIQRTGITTGVASKLARATDRCHNGLRSASDPQGMSSPATLIPI